MIPLILNIVFESENPKIWNNEPNSQTNDDENSDEIRASQVLTIGEDNIHPQYLPNSEKSYSSCSEEFKTHKEENQILTGTNIESNSAEKSNRERIITLISTQITF